jgi:hypothetical protein
VSIFYFSKGFTGSRQVKGGGPLNSLVIKFLNVGGNDFYLKIQ